MGFYSTLCGCRVSKDKVDQVAQHINQYSGVTHNYLRDHDYNLWFTLTAPSAADAEDIIKQIEQSNGIKVESMPAIKQYKIKVALAMGNENAR